MLINNEIEEVSDGTILVEMKRSLYKIQSSFLLDTFKKVI